MGPPKGRRVKNHLKNIFEIGEQSKARGGTGGGGGENAKMDEQLATLGLQVVAVTGDGNCFFRAIADQLEGNEEEHAKYRGMAVDYLEEHKEEFEPFLEEETTFDEYCINMRMDGTWAGHMELQATSLVTKCDICIHRVMFPRWQILNFQTPGTPILQLSYHGEEHYNSVRRVDDDGSGPAKLDTIKAEVEKNLVNDLPPAKDDSTMGSARDSDINLVVKGSGCSDRARVIQVMNEVHGDTDAAIGFLIAEGTLSEDSDSSTDLISFEGSYDEQLDTSLDSNTDMSLMDSDSLVAGHDSHVTRAKNALLHPAQAISRNRKCPCGSKKKYKACCGAVHARSGVTIMTSAQEGALSNRVRKERSRAAKGSPLADSPIDEVAQPKESDLGVLCI